MPDLASIVAANVRGERSRRRWRQKDLADALGWSQATVSDVEAGKRAVNVADLPLLCHALGITLADLFRGADSQDMAWMGMQ
ncbi:MAG TPA: helix-turn-helix transcriptional regulator [Kineosporiaceae bacterium]|nr:helix-turn-helix transcriptional regulator [Kineosporiaceae bacterium]